MLFFGCKSLKYVHLPWNIPKIGHEAFGDCENLEEVKIKNNIYSIHYIDGHCFSLWNRIDWNLEKLLDYIRIYGVREQNEY